ncbi:acetamidase/formamidase family protein [Roseovarius sp.]|jgi:amidase|uniref:acetamidase/formamidase family protein n=1 Tax=Roseovarius sp. TaxID=1486281 RepID=UPI002606E9FE|nr:acetamidase/formamidase family protein [Roseovarius sp.]MDM8167684.1 acetamidase/formamidase family protein [Roseovarius sp.]
MKTIKINEVQKYLLDARDEPVLRVAAGETFCVETDDALTGLVQDLSDTPKVRDMQDDPLSKELLSFNPPKLNPVVGPIYVEGAERGDVVEIEIVSVEPWRWGYTGILPNNGALRDSHRWGAEVRDLHIELIEHVPGPSGSTADGKAKYGAIEWDLDPFIGTLAVAPDREVVSSLTGQGDFCGNIDCRDIQAGNKIQINCNHDGALVYVGDCHGGQGDTEFTVLADETRATVKLKVNVIKNKKIPGVRIEKPDSIVAIGMDLPLDEAVYSAADNLMHWMQDEYGISPRDSYLRFSADPDFRVRTYQMVRASISHIAGAEYPKSRLKPAF